MLKRFWKGTSALELLFYAVFIATLLALTWPNFEAFRCRSAQSEAISTLNDIYLIEKNLSEQFGQYESLEKLVENHRVKTKSKYYNYRTLVLDLNSFQIEARGKENTLVAGDVWTTSQANNLENQLNVCEK